MTTLSPLPAQLDLLRSFYVTSYAMFCDPNALSPISGLSACWIIANVWRASAIYREMSTRHQRGMQVLNELSTCVACCTTRLSCLI